MLTTFRSRAALAAALLFLASCGEETPLPTNLETAAVSEDVALSQAAFENPQTQSLTELGYAMDDALIGFGGLASPMSSVVAAGPTRPIDPRSARRILARVEEFTATGPMSAIPAAVLGKTLVWNVTNEEYEISTVTGAPANGVRFRLYQIDTLTYLPADPLVYVGYADLVREGTATSRAARLALYNVGGTKLLEYVARLGGTPALPSFSVDGTAGLGPNAATFSLAVAVNAVNGNVTVVWRTAIPARGLTSRTTLGLSDNSSTINGVMQRGLSKIEISATVSFNSGGTVTVKVGNRTFATVTISAQGEPGEFVNADGQPLTPAQVATLEAIFDWFGSAFDWYGALLDPIYTVLDVPEDL